MQGKQCFIRLVLIPIGAVIEEIPAPKNEIVGNPKAADIWPTPESVAYA